MKMWNTNELLQGLEIKEAGTEDQFYCSEGYSENLYWLHISNLASTK